MGWLAVVPIRELSPCSLGIGIEDVSPQDPSASPPSVTISPVLAVTDGVSGTTLPGGLRVLDRLGLTPEGPLYRAEYPTGLEVVLATLRPEASGGPLSVDPATPARLQQWFDRAIQIQHPNVAAVHEMGRTDDGSVYVVLEALVGELLSNVLDARAAFPVHEAVDLCLQAAAGLQAAHTVGLVHGNLSPLTILVTQAPDEQPRVKLIRFALPPSSVRPQGVDRSGDEEVSPEYASPERIVGGTPDERSDVFSLGAVLHRLLAGAPPGFGSVERSIPEAMRPVLSRALAPAPAQRFQTMSEFATAVEHAAAEAGEARLPRVGRARVLAVAGAALVVVAAGLWVLGSSRWPAAGAAPRVSETDTRAPASAAQPARPAPAPDTPAAPLRATKPVAAPPPARPAAQDPERIRAAAAAATARLDEERRTAQAAKPEPPPISGYVAAERPVPATLEERAGVYARIGLDEASRQLGGPVHGIEGMSPILIGLAQGQLLAGGDASQPRVRAVYLDPNGRLILLDQQPIRPGQKVPRAAWNRWPLGNVMVSLHGEASPRTIGNLRARVR